MRDASYWIQKLNLLPHPEGGYYKETYRAKGTFANLDQGPERNYSTAIYFLMETQNFSAFHRIKSDELWHFYAGEPLEILYFDKTGSLIQIILGSNPEKGQTFQAVVPANSWFGSRPLKGSSYSLVGCTVSPGFDFKDFEMANKSQLLNQFSKHAEIIQQMCLD